MGTAPGNGICIETIINAPVEKVWQAWTVPDIILQWFGSDPNGRGISAALDVKPGGSFEISFSDSDGTAHTCNGGYILVEKFTKLKFSWTWKSEPGVTSFVTVVLTPENDNTQMNFTHANIGNASRHNYLQGWNATFTKLKMVLSKLG
jgi:uncharacterized protein YndB with AHSA1/START domain